MPGSILITGINGFVGTSIYNQLRDNLDITGLDISIDQKKQKCNTYNWDEFSKLPKVDAIIHLAGMAHDTRGSINGEKYFEINVGLTKNIFEYFLVSSATKFIFFSSVKAVADTVIGPILTEDVDPDPKTPYGKSKLEAETYLMSKALLGDKRLYILRPAMIHGPGNKGNLNLLFSMVQNGVPYPLGAFINQRSFTSINNMLFIIARILNGKIESGVYNICDDESLSTVEIVEMIYDSLNKKRRIFNVPKSIIQMIAIIGDVFRLPLNTGRLKKMTESYVVSNDKIKEALSIESLPTASLTGMRRTIKSFTKNQNCSR
jgi:nucleoside-diphosphate-sugar epimerase